MSEKTNEESYPAPYRAILAELRAIRKALEKKDTFKPVKETR